MIHQLGEYTLRPPDPHDLEALYQQKNDPEVAGLLGGFINGYSREDIRQWIDYHHKQRDEVVLIIADAANDRCLGHVGLYQIEHRTGSAEFAILIGDRASWGKGLGRICTRFMLEYGFAQLHLHRISLEVLASNERALRLYRNVGFREEGRKRDAQYKNGQYHDVICMGVLHSEYSRDH